MTSCRYDQFARFWVAMILQVCGALLVIILKAYLRAPFICQTLELNEAADRGKKPHQSSMVDLSWYIFLAPKLSPSERSRRLALAISEAGKTRSEVALCAEMSRLLGGGPSACTTLKMTDVCGKHHFQCQVSFGSVSLPALRAFYSKIQ